MIITAVSVTYYHVWRGFLGLYGGQRENKGVSIKIKLWTHKLVGSFSKHGSSIKLQLKSAEHHSWVFTETDV